MCTDVLTRMYLLYLGSLVLWDNCLTSLTVHRLIPPAS
jgi:hypothetical protein